MNSVVLIGRLTKDPELRYIPESQNAVATFTLAVDRPFAKDKQADFIRVVVYGKQAENCERFLTKGRLAGIQGRIQTGSYKNKEGATVYTTDVIADRVEFLGDRAGSSPGSGAGFEFERQDAKGQPGIPEGFQALEDDDDIPF
ncbi:MAG TPA: single-stranded DNA-binding protein [Anaerovoracaceae bacterium]|nr:single-stranded DNA-binding protein [Anaerovoracaceae bacterium]